MSAHLGDTEFVDLLEGTLPSPRARHADACATCRDRAETLRLTLAAAEEADVPEPSPLFWEHFSGRVHAAVANEHGPAGRWRRPLSFPAIRWASLAVASALLVALAAWRFTTPLGDLVTEQAQPPAVVNAPSGGGFAEYAFDDLDADEAWAVIRTVADDLDESAISDAGLGARPGSVERAANALSDTERMALAALVEREIAASKADRSS